jgi:hypothetical protein
MAIKIWRTYPRKLNASLLLFTHINFCYKKCLYLKFDLTIGLHLEINNFAWHPNSLTWSWIFNRLTNGFLRVEIYCCALSSAHVCTTCPGFMKYELNVNEWFTCVRRENEINGGQSQPVPTNLPCLNWICTDNQCNTTGKRRGKWSCTQTSRALVQKNEMGQTQ